MRPDTESLRYFVDRWLAKADDAPEDSLVFFDKFVFTYIPFNALYNAVAYELEGQGSFVRKWSWANGGIPKPTFSRQRSELARASASIIRFGGSAIQQALENEQCHIQAICNSISPTKLYLHEGRDGSPDFDLDQKMVEEIRKPDYVELLKLIYYVRCNLFHGGKALSAVQNDLLAGCTGVLRAVIPVVLEKIEQRSAKAGISQQ